MKNSTNIDIFSLDTCSKMWQCGHPEVDCEIKSTLRSSITKAKKVSVFLCDFLALSFQIAFLNYEMSRVLKVLHKWHTLT